MMDIVDLVALYWQVRDVYEFARSQMFHCESVCDRIGDAFYNGKADAYEQVLMALEPFLPST